MRLQHRIVLAACLLALGSCAENAPQRTTAAAATFGPDQTYLVGETAFTFVPGAVLQTWPLMPRQEPLRYARIALQMPADALDPALTAARPIQIDVLGPQQSPLPSGILAAVFTDWRGREAAPVGSGYHYDPRSKLKANGGRQTYRRDMGPADLIALLPTGGADAPSFFLHLDGNTVDRVIECRADVPPSKNVGAYCALRPDPGPRYGYRVFFPSALLPQWQTLDKAARTYIEAARR
ncbi:hypothetical protein [Dongia rigui]|uniref:Lipoprotein n=1 Tax=Dongia rigui TaxID=940149 RepID=A0ABU5DWK3_9PROT|nr:hypothetical protein [Dongia rigui]MDY0871691.1 hypothetical protein [Dongia rigui]